MRVSRESRMEVETAFWRAMECAYVRARARAWAGSRWGRAAEFWDVEEGSLPKTAAVGTEVVMVGMSAGVMVGEGGVLGGKGMEKKRWVTGGRPGVMGGRVEGELVRLEASARHEYVRRCNELLRASPELWNSFASAL